MTLHSRRSAGLAVVVLLGMITTPVLAGSMSLGWDAVSDADLAGYKLHYGIASGAYTNVLDVGNVTAFTLTGLTDCTRYYVAVKAYDTSGNLSLGFSNEIAGLPAPIVSLVSPVSGERGQALTLTVNGSNFDTGASVMLTDPKITVNSTTYLSCTQVSASIAIATDAVIGANDLDVVNPDLSYGRKTAALQVLPLTIPTVSSTSPANAATGVSLSVHPTVTFSEAVDVATVSATTITLLRPDGTSVPQAGGSPALDAPGTTATITPAAPLVWGTIYRVRAIGGASGVKDLAGNALASTFTQSPGFTTLAETVPSVVSTSPADAATNVAITNRPTVGFSERMDPATVTSSTVRLLGPGGAAVAQAAGSPSLDAAGTTATIVPAANLAYDTIYEVQVIGGASGVKDVEGSVMAGTFQHVTGFRTAVTPDTTPPSVSSTVPAASATNVALGVHPTVTFSEPVGAATVSATTIALLRPDGTSIPQAAGSPALDAPGTTATITPAAPLAWGTTYRVRAVGGASGVKDLAGNALASTFTQSPGFTTLAETVPSVVSTSPADAATGVAITVRPTASFSERMDPVTVTSSTVKLLGPGGTAVAQAAGSPSLDAAGTTATIVPAANLAYDTIYKVHVIGGSSGVKDVEGSVMAGTFQHATGFRTGVAPDTTPPTVSSTAPTAGATGVAPGAHPTVTFSEPVGAATVSATTITLLRPDGTAVPQAVGSPALDAPGTTVTITPASPLAWGTTYRVSAVGGSSGVKDLAGNALASTFTQSPGFTTLAESVPTVLSTNPAEGATSVAIAVRPTASFSERMDPATVTSSTVKLLGPGGAVVAQAAGSPSLDAAETTATIVPAANLAYDTIYKVQVIGGASGVMDLEGSVMAGTFQHVTGFRTAAAPDTTPPAVSSTSPAAGATNVALGIHPAVTFSEQVGAATVSATTITLLRPDGTSVPQAAGSPSLDAPGTTATITPAAPLAESTVYRIQVAGGPSGVKDLAGNALASTFTQSPGFTTGAAAIPAVVSTNPADAAAGVAITLRPTVTMNVPLDPTTVTDATVQILGPGAQPITQAAGSPSLDATGTIITIVPAQNLAYNTVYMIRVFGFAGGVRSQQGVVLPATYDQPTGFRTVPVPVPVAVSATGPSDGATGVDRNVHPAVIFTVPLDAPTVSATTIALLKPDGTTVAQAAGSPSLDASGTTATITPASALAWNTTFRIRVLGGPSGVKDRSGNSMSATFTQPAGFTTVASTPPVVSATSPPDGATGVPTSSRPTITFSEAMDPATIDSYTIRLIGPGAQPITQAGGSPSLDATARVVTIVPAQALGYNALYQIQVIGFTSGVKDQENTPMAQTFQQNIGFRVVPIPVPPTVTDATPADAATGILLDVRPAVTFSQPMNPTTINTTTVVLLRPDGLAVPQAPGSPSLDPTGRVVTIVPASLLAERTYYRIYVSGAKDLTGLTMAQAFSYNPGFQTVNLPPGTVPNLHRRDRR